MIGIDQLIDRPPNFILVNVHGLGDYLGVYGRPSVHTPWLDSLAYQGMLFEEHFVQNPVTDASSRPFVEIVPSLRQAGYVTQLIAPPLSGGCLPPFERRSPIDGSAEQASLAAVRFVMEHAADMSRPFFLLLSVTELLRRENGRFREGCDPELLEHLELPPGLPDTPTMRQDYGEYLCALQDVDFYLARLLDELEERGFEEDTLFILTSDGGPDFPRMRGTLYDAGLKAALLLRWPSILPGSFRASCLVTPALLADTILDLAGVTMPADPEATLRPLLDGGAYLGPSEIITDTDDRWPGRAIRTREYKLIRNHRPGSPRLLGRTLLARHGEELDARHFSQPYPPVELYDLRADPLEQVNLATAPEFRQVRQDLESRL